MVAEYCRALAAPPPKPGPETRVALVGHRAAGKSTLLEAVAALCERPAVDLDRALETRAGQPLRALFERDRDAFRAQEREAYQGLLGNCVVATGGGFLSHHADLLEDAVAVLVPVSFQTYCERLRADASRPRLYPDLPWDEELKRVFAEREVLHARAPTVGLGAFLAAYGELR